MSWEMYNMQVEFSELVGKTIIDVKISRDEIRFVCSDGSEYLQYHSQDCCECVTIEDVCGVFQDIMHSPVLVAVESTSNDKLPTQSNEYNDESFTWTFYKIDTAKGGVTIRWYGSSNGYYSESVSFARTKDAHTT